MAYKKSTTKKEDPALEDNENFETKENVTEEADKKQKMITKEFKDNDLIVCRSVTEGSLYMEGKKTGMLYSWSGYGDVQEVEFQDLRALLYAGSNYLKTPRFVIDDDELLNQPKWNTLKSIYESMYGFEDIDSLFTRSADSLRKLLNTMPEGMRQTVVIAAGDKATSGELDSIAKIRVLDEVLGTDFLKTIVT